MPCTPSALDTEDTEGETGRLTIEEGFPLGTRAYE